MIAVIETGGKQYLVKKGDVLKIEKLEAEVGTDFVFDHVLLVADEEKGDVNVGTPYIEGAKVVAKIEEHGKGDKITVVKYKRKVRYKRTTGHRQPFTKITITEIV